MPLGENHKPQKHMPWTHKSLRPSGIWASAFHFTHSPSTCPAQPHCFPGPMGNCTNAWTQSKAIPQSLGHNAYEALSLLLSYIPNCETVKDLHSLPSNENTPKPSCPHTTSQVPHTTTLHATISPRHYQSTPYRTTCYYSMPNIHQVPPCQVLLLYTPPHMPHTNADSF